MSDATLQRAWHAYYHVLATDPDSSPEQRQRGQEMLAKAPGLAPRAVEPEPEDLA